MNYFFLYEPVRASALYRQVKRLSNRYRIKSILFLLCLFPLFFSCKNEPTTHHQNTITLPNTPEAVCRTWQSYLDSNEIAKAMLLGSPKSKNWLKENQALFLADDELEPTQFLTLKCTQNDSKAICKYTLKEEGEIVEDFFTLVKINDQWLIHIEEQDSNDPNDQLFEKMKDKLELN